MSDVEQLPALGYRPTEYEALLAAEPAALEAIPGAVYLCDRDGCVVRYNSEAAQLWGQAPRLEGGTILFCGSKRLYLLDGTPLPHAECPMAEAVQAGAVTRNAEVVIERPDGSRITALVNIRPLRDHQGAIQGAINCFQDVSARRTMEEELLRRNRDLEDFFENSAVGLHIVDGEGVICRANKAELDLLGYPAEEYVGRHITEFHVDQPVIQDILSRLSNGIQLNRYPARLRARDGSIRHVLITSNGRFEDGKFISTRCFTTDVTDLREAEIARRESEMRLAATYEAATVGIAEVDQVGRYLRVNDALCKILGRPREKLLGANLLEITHEGDRDGEAAFHARLVRGELANYALQKRALRGNGSLVHLDVFCSSVRDAEGSFQYGVRVIQDVTDRKRMQDELRESERRLRVLLEAMPAAVYTTDAEGRITFYNQAAVELAGRKPEIGSDQWCVTWRLRWPDGRPMAHDECPMAIAVKEGQAIRGGEAIAERPDGSLVPFMAYPTPLYDPEGRVVGAINMLVDITNRKEAEARQRVLINELNHRVKNTLATVQSLAAQTARHAHGLEDFSASFQARVIALAKAHDLLTHRNWAGASLQGLLRDIVAPFADAGDRARTEGPAVDLNPREALSLTMALHELVTNAAKYGALSNPAGAVLVRWEIRDGAEQELVIQWAEQGGPRVLPPSHRGFGSRLMERCIRHDLRGKIDVQYEPGGVLCQIAFPLTSTPQHH
jgi:PAS domain S-box-containing protein